MSVFSHKAYDGHEEVVFCHDEETNLKAIIAVHNTLAGPGMGGCRMWPYGSDEEALNDVLRLSRGMTYKSAIVEIPFGGGKSVIFGNPTTDKTVPLLNKMGEFVHSLGGKYIIAEDVGIAVEDMMHVRTKSPYVTGLPSDSGDPSPATAFGIYQGMKAAALVKFGKDNLKDIKVAVQGLGKVGYELCEYLYKDGAILFVTDMNKQACQKAQDELKAQIVPLDKIYDVEADIFAPCALGAVINEKTIPRLKVKVIAGSANNQLESDLDAERLDKKEILYTPDYVINAGGVINVAEGFRGQYNKEKSFKRVSTIYDRLLEIFKRAERDRITTYLAAERVGRDKLEKLKSRK